MEKFKLLQRFDAWCAEQRKAGSRFKVEDFPEWEPDLCVAVDIQEIADMIIPLGEMTHKEAGGFNERMEACKDKGHFYTCKHLQPNGDCGNYEKRPAMCRDFPYGGRCNYKDCTWESARLCTKELETTAGVKDWAWEYSLVADDSTASKSSQFAHTEIAEYFAECVRLREMFDRLAKEYDSDDGSIDNGPECNNLYSLLKKAIDNS